MLEDLIMTKKLFFEAISKFLLGVILIGLLIFLPANTLKYKNGWIFMGLLFIPMLIAGIFMMIKNPKLLASRLDAKEKQKEQNIVIKISGLMFIVGFILAGFDFRYNWSNIPPYFTYIFSVIFLLSYFMWAIVLKQNTYLSRTIKVEESQTVIDTGLYSVIRHPMYTATIFLFLSMPLILGSLISFFVFLIYPILIIIRIINEEKYLTNNLEGYKEYKKKVKYRLIPFIW
jgi:protein-S-isoprenylcysteine O-methyltransferase Ste14